jgi:F-type H+-transporting ATPase subunit b
MIVKLRQKNYFNQAREKIIKDINFKKESLEKEINEEISKAETEIKDFMNKVPEKVNKIAIDTSADLVKQLIGADVNNSSISAIVADLSIKNRNKYYDN